MNYHTLFLLKLGKMSQNLSSADAVVLIQLLHCSLNLLNRLDEIESAVFKICRYGKCSKISNTSCSWQKAKNSTDPDQTVSEEVV